MQDAEARRIAAALLAGEDIDDPERSPIVHAIGAARRASLRRCAPIPRCIRAFVRTFNLLLPPDTLISDADLGARVLAVWNDRASRPPEQVLGPPRPELLEALGLAA